MSLKGTPDLTGGERRIRAIDSYESWVMSQETFNPVKYILLTERLLRKFSQNCRTVHFGVLEKLRNFLSGPADDNENLRE